MVGATSSLPFRVGAPDRVARPLLCFTMEIGISCTTLSVLPITSNDSIKLATLAFDGTWSLGASKVILLRVVVSINRGSPNVCVQR